MRATPLGTAVLVALWAGLGVAFALGAWGPGLAAVGAMGVLASTRRPFLPPRPDITRRVEGEPVQGAVLTVTTGGTAPTQGLLDVEAPLPLGVRLVRETRRVGRGSFEVVQEVQAQAVGQLAWPPVRLRATDRWGLAAEEREVAAPASVAVLPDSGWAIRGRRLGLKAPVSKTVRAPIASERALEIERVRPYLPGDPLRDIDWKATSRHKDLQVRERERHIPRPVTVVLDCGTGMRVQRHAMKLTSASRVAYGTLAAATGAGTLSHLVVVQERACRSVPVRGLGEAERALREVLAASPPLPPEQAGSEPPSAAQVLQAVGATPGLMLLVLDAEHEPAWVEELLLHLKRLGPVALAVPATGAHLYRRGEARGAVLRALRRWRRARKQVERACARLRVPCWVLRPGNEEEILGQVGRMLA